MLSCVWKVCDYAGDRWLQLNYYTLSEGLAPGPSDCVWIIPGTYEDEDD